MAAREFLHRVESFGSGRALVALVDESSPSLTPEIKAGLAQFLEERSSSATIHNLFFRAIDYRKTDEMLLELSEYLREKKVRQASFVTIGGTSTLLWRLAITNSKLIRFALVLNGEARPEMTAKEQLLQWLEEKLPLGLPFRVSGGKFYALPFLQRFRFPVGVVSLGAEHVEQSDLLVSELPVAWKIEIDSIEDLNEAFSTLAAVPTKCPQKNRSAA